VDGQHGGRMRVARALVRVGMSMGRRTMGTWEDSSGWTREMAESASSYTESCREIVDQTVIAWVAELVGRAEFAGRFARRDIAETETHERAQTVVYEQQQEIHRKVAGGGEGEIVGGAIWRGPRMLAPREQTLETESGIRGGMMYGARQMTLWMIPTLTGRRTTTISEDQMDFGSPLVLAPVKCRGKGQDGRMCWSWLERDFQGQAQATDENIRQNDGGHEGRWLLPSFFGACLFKISNAVCLLTTFREREEWAVASPYYM